MTKGDENMLDTITQYNSVIEQITELARKNNNEISLTIVLDLIKDNYTEDTLSHEGLKMMVQ